MTMVLFYDKNRARKVDDRNSLCELIEAIISTLSISIL